DMPVQIDRIEQILEAMNVPVLRVDGFEADDVIGTLAKRASAATGCDVFICSKDKDMLQLLDKHISTFDIKTDTATDVTTMRREMKVTPQQFLDCLALQGDKADNVPGIPDVGPKTALDWIQKYGSIENLYKHLDEIKGKRGDNLRSFKDNLALSKELVTIDCNTPIEFDPKALALKKFNEPELARIFSELGFNRLLTQLGLTAPTSPKAAPTKKTLVLAKAQAGVRKVAQDFTKPTSTKTASHDYQLIDTKQKFDKFFNQLKKQKLFAIDTETTAINAMRANLVGISFSWQPKKAFYLPVKAPLGQKHLSITEVRRKLTPILADESVKKIGQNIKYDMLVLKNAKMPIKGVHFDTMVASYCLDPLRT
ncbi:unnamed protein product, partial [marine sediment metagenome]